MLFCASGVNISLNSTSSFLSVAPKSTSNSVLASSVKLPPFDAALRVFAASFLPPRFTIFSSSSSSLVCEYLGMREKLSPGAASLP